MALLDDKVAIVTGSARGIGRATVELLAGNGAKVLINDLDGDLTNRGRPARSSHTSSTPGTGSTSSSTTPATRSTGPRTG